MERRKEEVVGDVLLRFLRATQLEAPLNEYRLIQAWHNVAGTAIDRQTTQLKIHNQVLFVGLNSAALRSELSLRRAEFVRKLNEAVGSQVIIDIRYV